MLFFVGCAGMQPDCSDYDAGSFGGDWLILQYSFDGKPINCWKLTNTATENDPGTNGISWQDAYGRVHISGWYTRIQVLHSDYTGAAKSIGVSLDKCVNGKYVE